MPSSGRLYYCLLTTQKLECQSLFIIAMKENWPFIKAYTHVRHHLPLTCSHKLPRLFRLLPSGPKPLLCISFTFSSYSYAALKTDLNFIHLSLLQSIERGEKFRRVCVVGVAALVPSYVRYCLKLATMWRKGLLTSVTCSAPILIRRSPARI